MMGLRKIIDGNGDTQLSEHNTRSGRLQASATAKNMKIWPENRRNGLYEPGNAIFKAYFSIFRAYPAKNGPEMTKFRSNNH